MTNEKYAILFKNCILVEGFLNTIVCDLQLNRYLIIPKPYIDVLKNLQSNKIEDVVNVYNQEGCKNVLKFISFLVEKNYMFYTDSISQWGDFDLQWSQEGEITNAIIDIVENHFYFKNSLEIIGSLISLGCRFIQFRFYESLFLSFEELEEALEVINGTDIFSTEILIEYNNIFTLDGYKKLIDKFQKINFVLYNYPYSNTNNTHRIKTTSKNIVNEKCCGKVSQNLFQVNVKKFSESINFNSCLNRKISIDKNGDIRNCPSMKYSFGNIRNSSLVNVVRNSDLSYYWSVTKDKIEVCRECEFRYICTDCRAYLQDPQNKYSKPLKCGYNPKNGEWEDWSKNPLNKKAITTYGL